MAGQNHNVVHRCALMILSCHDSVGFLRLQENSSQPTTCKRIGILQSSAAKPAKPQTKFFSKQEEVEREWNSLNAAWGHAAYRDDGFVIVGRVPSRGGLSCFQSECTTLCQLLVFLKKGLVAASPATPGPFAECSLHRSALRHPGIYRKGDCQAPRWSRGRLAPAAQGWGSHRDPLPRFTVLANEQKHHLRNYFRDWGALLLRVLVPRGHACVAGHPILQHHVPGAMAEAGFEGRRYTTSSRA